MSAEHVRDQYSMLEAISLKAGKLSKKAETRSRKLAYTSPSKHA